MRAACDSMDAIDALLTAFKAGFQREGFAEWEAEKLAAAVEVFKGRQITLRALLKDRNFGRYTLMYGFDRDSEIRDQIELLRKQKQEETERLKHAEGQG